MRSAGIVVAGGESSRMGASKPTLDWHGEALVQRVVGLVARGVDGPVVVVAPPAVALPSTLTVVRDEVPGLGPLAGLAAGLASIDAECDVVFVVAADTPLLHPRLVRRILELLGPHDDAAVPFALGFRQSLCAAYRPRVRVALEALLADGIGAAGALPQAVGTRWLEEADLAEADPGLGSLSTCNTPAEYEALLALPAPRISVAGIAVCGWTLGDAYHAAGLDFPVGDVLIDGVRVAAALAVPLAEGETIEPAAGEAR